MKFLTSAWGLAIIAIVLTIETMAGMLYAARASFSAASPAAVHAKAASLWSFKPDEVDKLISQLGSERKKLDARETDLNKLEAQVASERAELEKVRSGIQTSKDELAAAVSEVQDSESKNIKTLAQTYSAVSPRAAVAIFAEMDDTMAVKILATMKAEGVGAIFQEMANKNDAQAKRVARLSDKLRLFKRAKSNPPPQP